MDLPVRKGYRMHEVGDNGELSPVIPKHGQTFYGLFTHKEEYMTLKPPQLSGVLGSIVAQQEAKVQQLIDTGLTIEYIASHYTIIKGPMDIRTVSDGPADKILIKVSQFWELCPNEKLEERLKELAEKGMI